VVLAVQRLSHKRVHCREPIQHGRVVLLVEGQSCETDLHQWADAVRMTPPAVVLLAGLEEARVVDAAVAFELVGLLGDGVQLREHILEDLLLLFGRDIGCLVVAVFFGGGAQWLEFFLALFGPITQFLDLLGLEIVHLLELHIDELLDKGTLIILGPLVVVVLDLVVGRPVYGFGLAEELLELIIVDVLVLPRRVDRVAEDATKTHVDGGSGWFESGQLMMAALWLCRAVQWSENADCEAGPSKLC
jgi:hypothetical protein